MSGQPRSGFSTRGPPLGIKLFQKILPSTSIVKKNIWYRGVVLLLTFWSYVNYHATRKTLSVVKNTLIQNCTDGSANVNGVSPCAWEPFDGPDAKALLGTLDSAFLFSYAFFMFIR
ncbi:glucose-6-phosphate exchanger SLC37A2-like [Diaphorina citri]|uniref:Glucose-6-phosphate exchanger SLC37A2-like n=1 Tax=Diaphorina citri TaxID=121845 RepID=A0A3Q0ITP6_DIACI|nr:glucose-6-phosphate exchanger SLC37A2-like [Diaphorina citri]